MDKKTIKEFLKPDLRKILIFIFLAIILSYFFQIIPTFIVVMCSFPPCPPMLQFKSLSEIFFGLKYSYTMFLESIFLFIIELFGIYILSCLIISTYDKFKTKNKN